jgi:hypothetical protein
MESQLHVSNILWKRLHIKEEEKESMTSEQKLRHSRSTLNSKSSAAFNKKMSRVSFFT